MSAREFEDEATKKRVASAIAEIEKESAAEVMVAVRPSSGTYRDLDYLVGVVLAFAGLLVFLFYPKPMRVDVFALEAPLLFLGGTLLSIYGLAPLRRMLASKRRVAENVERAARAAFVELGVSKTRGRTGVLVYVSLFERAVFVVSDIGVDVKKLDSAYNQAISRLNDAIATNPDPAAFIAALAELGKVLTELLPVQADDIDELSNEMSVAS